MATVETGLRQQCELHRRGVAGSVASRCGAPVHDCASIARLQRLAACVQDANEDTARCSYCARSRVGQAGPVKNAIVQIAEDPDTGATTAADGTFVLHGAGLGGSAPLWLYRLGGGSLYRTYCAGSSKERRANSRCH